MLCFKLDENMPLAAGPLLGAVSEDVHSVHDEGLRVRTTAICWPRADVKAEFW